MRLKKEKSGCPWVGNRSVAGYNHNWLEEEQQQQHYCQLTNYCTFFLIPGDTLTLWRNWNTPLPQHTGHAKHKLQKNICWCIFKTYALSRCVSSKWTIQWYCAIHIYLSTCVGISNAPSTWVLRWDKLSTYLQAQSTTVLHMLRIHSPFCSLSYDRPIAFSKASCPRCAI